ncbi:MAG: dephospho-CoA kinase [Planctomycetota bacterium]
MIVGILGGIGAGKSTVTRMFVDEGAEALDADRIAHDVLDLPVIQKEVRDRWGADVFDAEGRVDRARLAAVVFERGKGDGTPSGGTETELSVLESLIHPEVRRRIEASIRRFRSEGGKLLILDVPLLLGTPLEEHCEALLFVDSRVDARIDRTESRGWSPDDHQRRESRQAPVDAKRLAATHTIDNKGDLDALREQVQRLAREWTQANNPSAGAADEETAERAERKQDQPSKRSPSA